MTDLRQAAQRMIDALNEHLYMNDYCGLEVDKRHAPKVSDALESLRSELAAAPQAEPVAWVTPDGDRAVTHKTMEGARRDGGAMLSGLREFNVPAYAHHAPAADVNAELLEALKLADAMLSGANMNAKVVEAKVRAAIEAAMKGADHA